MSDNVAAEGPHFRIVDDRRMVLYQRGDLVPPAHAALPAVLAEQVDGVWRPTQRKAKK